jgi:hypothetical protein
MAHQDICIDLVASPEPSDHEGKYDTENPWIRDISSTDIIDRKKKHLRENKRLKRHILFYRLDRPSDEPPYQSRSTHNETDEHDRIAEFDEVWRTIDAICEEESSYHC